MGKYKFNRMISSRSCSLVLLLILTLVLKACANDRSEQDGFVSSSNSFPRGFETSGENINEIARLPAWSNQPASSDQRVDFNQLLDLMGETVRSRQEGPQNKSPRRQKPKCNRRININNGVTRLRERGNLARFQCSHGYTLIGPTTIVCLQDRWSEPPPICVRGGCRSIRRPQNAEVRHSIGGAVVAFYCSGETKLVGDPVLYCDGVRWNGTEPICYAEPKITTPEPMEIEEWPESVPTPASEGIDNQDSNWDNNNLTVDGETTAYPAEIATTEPQNNIIRGSTVAPNTNGDTENDSQVVVAVTLAPDNEVVPTTNAPEVLEVVTERNEHFEGHVPIMNQTTQVPFHPTQNQDIPETSTVAATTTTTSAPTTLATTTTALPKKSISPRLFPVTLQPTMEVDPFLTTLPHLQPTTTSPPVIVPVTTRRRFKIITKRPRRPIITKRPRRPIRRTTTTIKPSKTKPPVLMLPTTPFLRPSPTLISPTEAFKLSAEISQDSPPAPVDYPIAIDKEFLPREQVEPIRPIIFPDMLGERAQQGTGASAVVGIVLLVVSLSTFTAGVVFYCWRKNKGIARARPYDMDGRTLSAHDANDDFTWIDQRDSGL